MSQRVVVEIEFGELPPIDHSNRHIRATDPAWAAIATELRERIGEWACLGRMPATQVTNIKRGKLAAFRPPGAFEATGREVDERGQLDVWARYVGEPS